MAVATVATSAPADSDARAWQGPSTGVVTWLLGGASLLALGGVLWALSTIQLASPGFLTIGPATSVGRMRPAATTLLLFGGLGMTGTGVAIEASRRLVRRPVASERVAAVSAVITLLAVVVGTLAILKGHSTGRPGLELPRPVAGLLAVGLLGGAAVLLRTVASREDDDVHPALWHLGSAVVAGPALILLGHLPRLRGFGDEAARVFAVNGLLLLWLVQLGIGIAYVVVPSAARTALANRRLARLGFWSWVLIAPLAGPVRLVAGPGPQWWESVGTAAAVGLLLPVLAIATVIGQTLANRRALAASAELRLAALGTGALVVLGLLAATTGGRGASERLRLTVFGDALPELAWVGVAGALIAAGVARVLPGATGNRLYEPRTATRTAWLLGTGISLVVLSLLVGGAVQGALAAQATRDASTGALGSGWDAVSDAIAPWLALRALGELLVAAAWIGVLLQIYSTVVSGEPLEVDDAPTSPGRAPVRA